MTRPEPFAHQTQISEIARDREHFAYLCEQGTGKTRIEIDVTFDLYAEGKIDALIVLAPNGVHQNWVNNELPLHAPNDDWRAVIWQSAKAASKWFQKDLTILLNYKGLAILCMNIDAITTTAGKDFLQRFVKARRCRIGVDECTIIKTPKAKRTRAAILLGKKGVSRFIMTGTPITQGPLDVFAPFKFLNENILGFRTYSAFKAEYGVWVDMTNGATGMAFKKLVGYRNVEQLQKDIDPHSIRVTKEQCLDLPPKLYEKRYFDLPAEIMAKYRRLRDECEMELDGEIITITLALTILLRLQQMICGAARLKALEELLETLEGKAIIWARFKDDIDAIMELLGTKAVRYDGQTSTAQRTLNIEKFQNVSECRYFVGNPHAGGYGITLHAATSVIYYSNDFSLEVRLQSEDRAHRIGQEHAVTYYDIIANNTVDNKIVNALLSKKNVADAFLSELKNFLK